MNKNIEPVRIAAAQATPYFLNRGKTVDKACDLISQAGKNGAKLIVFPEVFVPGYPDWVWVVPNGNGGYHNELYLELVENAISIPDPSTQQLCQAAKDAGIYVAIGIHERNSEASGSTLFNTLLYINGQGSIIGKHRKLIPTGGERMIWGRGNGSTLPVFETPFGKLGGLICWENYMPLARQAMYMGGTQVYVAPTWDSSENWLHSLRHIAREGGMFVIGCCMLLGKADIPDHYAFKELYPGDAKLINPGNSCIINPSGEFIAGPSSGKEALIYADIDLREITRSKRMFDVAGHYARPDVFKFSVYQD
jgi:nitrilase